MENTIKEKIHRPLGEKKDWDLIAGLTGTEEGYDNSVIKPKPRHYQAISFLLQGYSYTDVANELDVSKRTVLRWFEKGSICYEILSERRYAIWMASQQQLLNLHSQAILEMNSLIHSDTETTRLRAASFILSNLKPEKPVNPEELSEAETRKYNELRQGSRCAYHVTWGRSFIVGDRTIYGIDPEDHVYEETFEYPADGFDNQEPDPVDRTYRKIELSTKQIQMITTKLTSAGVFTEKYMNGVAIRDKEGFVVGELHPSDSNRPSYARGDRKFYEYYRPYINEFFINRPEEMVTDRWRDAEGISQTDDLDEIIKMFVGLGNVSIPEKHEEDDIKDAELLPVTSANEWV